MDPDDLVQPTELAAFSRGERHSPHAILGAHPAEIGGQRGVVVRAYHPDAAGCGLVREGSPPEPMLPLGDGLFAVFVPGASTPLEYRLRFLQTLAKIGKPEHLHETSA